MRTDVERPTGESITHRYAGDWRGLLVAAGTGILQLMHPAISAGVIQHSKFFDEPFERIIRSLPPIGESKFGGSKAQSAAVKIRDYHRDIKGIDADGNRYHALDPEVYFWAHATFVRADMTWLDLYHHRLSERERERIYAEGLEWYERYGVSSRMVPENLAAFDDYWEYMCHDVLEATEAARWAVGAFDDPARTPLPGVNPLLWTVVAVPLMREAKLLTAAMMAPAVRDKLGLRYSWCDSTRFAVRVQLLRLVHPVLNPVLRHTLTGVAPR